MTNKRQQHHHAPFIHRALRPEVDSNKPGPPLLELASSAAKLRDRARKVLREGRTDRLDLDGPTASALRPQHAFAPHPDVIAAQLDGETVLLDVRTARSYTLNCAGTVICGGLAPGVELTMRKGRAEVHRTGHKLPTDH